MAAPTPTLKGVSTIKWGTSSTLPNLATAVVDVVSITPKNAGPIGEIENNDGAAKTLVFLNDGFDAKVTTLYDSAVAWPVDYSNVNLAVPVPDGNANTAWTTFVCIVASTVPALSRKKEAMLELNLVYRPGLS